MSLLVHARDKAAARRGLGPVANPRAWVQLFPLPRVFKVPHAKTTTIGGPLPRQHSLSIRTLAAIAPIFVLGSALQSQPAPAISDSSSIRVLEYATIKGAPIALRIDPAPRLSLGGLQTDLRAEFPSPTGNSWNRLADGRMVVDGRRELKVFDRNGRVLNLIGRQGAGPGEFVQNYLSNVCVVRGDTIVTFEGGQSRMSVFDAAGKFVRQYEYNRAVSQVAGNVCFSDATFIVFSSTIPDPTAPPGSPTIVEYRRIRTDGSVVAPIGKFASGHTAISDSLLVVGNGREAEFRVMTARGRVTTIVRWKDALEPIPEGRRGAGGGGPTGGSTAAAGRGQARGTPPPTPTTLPAYSTIYVDPARRIWLRDNVQSSVKPSGWTLFSISGQLLGRVVVPSLSATHTGDARILAFDSGNIVLRWTDDDGIHITVHGVG